MLFRDRVLENCGRQNRLGACVVLGEVFCVWDIEGGRQKKNKPYEKCVEGKVGFSRAALDLWKVELRA